jgi:hypothetical protein
MPRRTRIAVLPQDSGGPFGGKHSSWTLGPYPTQGASRSGSKYQRRAHWGTVPIPASCREHHQRSNKPAARPFLRLSSAAQPYSAMKRITVLRTARERASPVGREEAAERRRRVNSTQALVGRFSRRSAIPSSWDWPCGGEGAESVCLERGGWDSTTDTSGEAGLVETECHARWPYIPAVWRSGCDLQREKII